MQCFIAEPYFKNPPVDVSVLENEDAEFNCNAGGKPQATITWSLNGKLLSGVACTLIYIFL